MTVRHIRRFILLTALLLGCGVAYGQAGLVSQVEEALRADNGRAAVYDLGHLLKPGGVRELKQRAEQLRAQGINVYFVTVPRGSTDVPALAETVYRDLDMGDGDLLVVFDGRQVYGKSLALQGQPQAFQEALREAAPGFRLYYAMGLSQFAQAVADRIRQRQGAAEAEQQAAASRARLGWAIAALVVLIIAAVVAVPRVRQRVAVRQEYRQQLQAAEQLYDRITINMSGQVPPSLNEEWVRLDDRLRRCRQQPGATAADVRQLAADLERFDRRLNEPPPAG